MKCSKCNYESEQEFTFCPACGEKVKAETEAMEFENGDVTEKTDNNLDSFVKAFVADKKKLCIFILGLITTLSSLISITEFNFTIVPTLALYCFFIFGVITILYSVNVLKKTNFENDILFGGIALVFIAFLIRFIQLGIAYSWESYISYILKSITVLFVLNKLLRGKEKFKLINTMLILLSIYDVFIFISSGNAFFNGFVWKLFHITEASLLISLIFVLSQNKANLDEFRTSLKIVKNQLPKLKTVMLIMIIPIIISLVLGIVKETNINSANNTVSPNVNNVFEAKQNKKKDANIVNLGETISLNFAEINIDAASYCEELKPTDTSSVYSYYEDESDKKYFYLQGTIKNTGGFNYGVDNICVEMKFDDKYSYNGWLIADDGGNDFYGDNVDPFDSVKFYIYSSIPDELINQYKKCTISFGFDENFGYNGDNTYSFVGSMNECDYRYQITVIK